LIDFDNDTFSDFPTLRGYDWKGFDCNDSNANIYPGRKSPSTETDPNVDYNCNGIYGVKK
jgi:acyloxyacyl hydrolase